MKNIMGAFLLIVAAFLAGSCKMKQLRSMAATETFPQDSYLNSAAHKRAMIIVAHDDDACAMYGTIAQLHAAGWQIKALCFQTEDTARDQRHRHALRNIVDAVEFIPVTNRQYRNDLDSNKAPYLPIPRDQFAVVFNREIVVRALGPMVNGFRPSVIFTLDNEIGGYGHPDHVFISQLVRDLCESHAIHTKRIYQSVYTDHMEEEIMVKRLASRTEKAGFISPYMAARSLYGITGMPAPTVGVNIQDQAVAKMAALRAYGEKERANLRKFMPEFEKVDAEKYFGVFGREFFRVVEIQ